MTKAVHEAKVNLSWVNQNPEYVDALTRFVERILTPGTEARPNRFLALAEPFVAKISFFGAINSLSQLLVKLTSPGVPDVYQGQELWDFSLVDPDNRREVDFALRQRLLAEMLRLPTAESTLELCADMLRNWKDGRAKLWVTTRGLSLRREKPQLFAEAAYVPLGAAKQHARHVIREVLRERVRDCRSSAICLYADEWGRTNAARR
jgi:(1->4)-alpha-D-glucan 1-alpha-D-glucosylmutase